MAEKTEAKSETRIIIPTIGPYAGQRMMVDAKEADQAISEGWASDPFAAPKAPPKEGEASKEPTDEERAEMAKKAEAAAKRWRGEEPKDPDKHEATTTRDMTAGPGRNYETRDAPKAETTRTEPHKRR